MLIIDESVAQKFAETLTPLRKDPGATHYIYFSFREIGPNAELREVVIRTMRAYMNDPAAHLYCFEDGDMCILAHHLPSKEGHQIMLALGEHLNRPVTDQWVSFFDLNTGLNRILTLLEQKLDKVHSAEEAERKRQEQLAHERNRQNILNANPKAAFEEITRRRRLRTAPHLMMIEDDTFSSRLVETSLKQYRFTTLHSAQGALTLYADIAPNLIFLDINLPDVTGHELLARILAIDPDAYVIMLSGNADRENVMQAMSKGAKGFVAKPFTRDKLIQYIDRCPTIHHPAKEATPCA